MSTRTDHAPEGDYDRCGALKRDGSGSTCRLPAGHGTKHVGSGRCRRHGGNTPTHEARAREAFATRAVATYGLPRDVAPLAALEEELHRTAGHVAWLELTVRTLMPEDLHGPVGGGNEGIPREEPSIWLRLYADERAHLVRVAKTCSDVGIEEKRQEQLQSAGAEIAARFRAFAAALGLDMADTTVQAAARIALTQTTTDPIVDTTAQEAA